MVAREGSTLALQQRGVGADQGVWEWGANEVVVWVTNGWVGGGEEGGGVSSPRDSDKCASY